MSNITLKFYLSTKVGVVLDAGFIIRFLFLLYLFPLGKGFSDDVIYKVGDVFQDCEECPEMIVIEQGVFKMGSPPSALGRPAEEGAVRPVKILKPYAIGLYEVTQENWDKCFLDGGCDKVVHKDPKGDKYPVANVSWKQAHQYVTWISSESNLPYRLPTETEWEYAARAGSDRSRFFGFTEREVCQQGNVYDETAKVSLGYEWESLPCSDGYIDAAPVGSFKPNKFGVFDMLGNVWEWTQDCASASTRGIRTDYEAVESEDCSHRSYRGSSWLSPSPRYIKFSDRYKFINSKDSDLGFRVARDVSLGLDGI